MGVAQSEKREDVRMVCGSTLGRFGIGKCLLLFVKILGIFAEYSSKLVVNVIQLTII